MNTIKENETTRQKANKLATFCNNLEKEIRNEKNEIKRVILEKMLTIADRNFDNVMESLENDLMDQ